jgi:hypothetical protein
MDMKDFAAQYTERTSELTERWDKAKGTAQVAYDKIDTEARRRRTEARNAADAAYTTATDEAMKVYREARDKADRQLAEDTGALLQELVGDGGDDAKLAAWMIKEGWWRRFPSHCTVILKAMPMTFEQFKGFRTTQGWCDDYDTFLANALQAGVIPGVTPLAGALYVMQQAITKADIYSSERRALNDAFGKLAEFLPQDSADAAATAEKSEA